MVFSTNFLGMAGAKLEKISKGIYARQIKSSIKLD